MQAYVLRIELALLNYDGSNRKPFSAYIFYFTFILILLLLAKTALKLLCSNLEGRSINYMKYFRYLLKIHAFYLDRYKKCILYTIKIQCKVR